VSEHDVAVETRAVSKTFGSGPNVVTALHEVSLTAHTGTLTAVVGRSGSGKTTLLNVIGGLEDPTSGEVVVGGNAVQSMNDEQRSAMRRTEVAFIFQAFGLLPVLTAVENVEVPMRLVGADPAERRDRAHELLSSVGLADRALHRPAELSGGEQQRVAIARALANRPRVLLADEPTGQLDSRTGAAITELIAALVREEGIAAIVATHDAAPRAAADTVLEIRDGRLRPM
jgi:putative ABC transport system ATP-binding protein